MRKSILIICICFNNYCETIKYVKEVITLSHGCVEFLVVDNSCNYTHSNPLDSLKQFGSVEIIISNKNLGYFGGAEYGLSKYLRKFPMPDIIVISNTDIIYPDPQFYNKLLKMWPFNFIIAPKIISSQTQQSQNPYMVNKPSKQKMLFLRIIFSNRYFYYVYSYISQLKILAKKTICKFNIIKPLSTDIPIDNIYAPHGSFVIFPRLFFDLTDGFKHDAFLFNEEIVIAEKAKKNLILIKYIPKLVVIHDEHQTTGELKNKTMVRYLKESNNIIYSKYFK